MKQTIELFKVVVAERTGLNFAHALDGFVTDFTPSPDQVKLLREIFQPLQVNTLFSVEERKNASLEHLISKQILHYIEVYGLDSPGLFELEVSSGRIATLAFVKAVTITELQELVHNLIYANRPIADITPVVEVMREYGIQYDINLVQNNELRVALYDPTRDTFKSGDDAVRWILYQANDKNPLLIKNRHMESLVAKKPAKSWFLQRHQVPLAQVFNRHKRLIMACKNPETASIINKISKLSKTRHVPVMEPVSKRFVSGAIKGEIPTSVLDKISVRDKFKFLNLIEYKRLGLNYDTFNIRNGKVWFELDRKILDKRDLKALRALVLLSLNRDLASLNKTSILLDPHVNYGLPVSRKQAVGNLPFGTRITGEAGKKLSAGIYWEDGYAKWKSGEGYYTNSVDLDLSTIDSSGNRVGWGGYAAYAGKDLQFSGDVTAAPKGATEFFTVDPARPNRYGMMVNVYRGAEEMDVEIVVGHPSKKDWQDQTFIRERTTLYKKQSVLGFIKDDAFVVYSGGLSASRVSSGKHPVLDKGFGVLWTVGMLFDLIGVKYDLVPQADKIYDFDLRYMNFTQDKLEKLFNI